MIEPKSMHYVLLNFCSSFTKSRSAEKPYNEKNGQ